MPTILIPSPLPAEVTRQLEAANPVCRLWEQDDHERTLADIAPTVRAIAAGGHSHIDAAFMQRLPHLEIVSNFGVGYDNIDAKWAGRQGIVVTNTPDVLNEEVADTALALILATVRQIPAAERHLRQGLWLERPFPLSSSLRGRTLGILGLGRIGKAIARRAEAFGLDIIYHGRHAQPGVPYLYFDSVLALAEACDILVVITPGGSGTDKLVDAAVLRALGNEGILINVSRGSVVDEQALIDALHDGVIRSAGLDVFDKEPQVPQALLDMDHVVLLPHVGSASVHTRNAMGQLVVDNLRSWFEGRGPLTPVAETPWSPKAA